MITKKITIAVDAMGGDNAPSEICKGVIDACRSFNDIEIILTGDKSKIQSCLSNVNTNSQIKIVHADDIIQPDEHPAVAIRKKKNSSLRIAMEMVRSGEAQGCVSAGSTGAIVAGGVLIVGRVPGIDRPALGVPLPTIEKTSFMLDVGATVRCKPENLLQFALMGNIYSRKILRVESPEIKLLSNGTENIKGDETILGAKELIRQKNSLNFQGYIEGNDIVWGRSDVIVCDGFNGNVSLKLAEGIMQGLKSMLTEEVKKSFLAKAGIVLMSGVVKKLWTRFNYEKYGGTPLLGVNGAVIKAHGRSKAPAIFSALSAARNFILEDGVSLISQEI